MQFLQRQIVQYCSNAVSSLLFTILIYSNKCLISLFCNHEKTSRAFMYIALSTGNKKEVRINFI